MRNQQGKATMTRRTARTRRIHFERVSLKDFKRLPEEPDPGHYTGPGFNSQKKKKKRGGNCVWLTRPLGRRLSQVACLLKEEYFTIKMFLW